MNKPIDSLINDIETYIKSENPNFIRSIELVYRRLIYNVHTDVVRQYSKGYCMRLMIPERDVLATYKSISSITIERISSAFAVQWVLPTNAHMHNSPYYQVLMLTFLLACKNKLDDLAKYAISLVLFRIWNGRIIGAIRYCDPDTMNYVTNIMMTSNKYKAKIYPSPFEMLIEYFTPTIYEFYKPNVIRDSTETKRVFEACFARVKQVFRSNSVINLKTGEKKYMSGLQPLYYKAKAEGLKMSTVKNTSNENVDDFFSSSMYEEQINDIITFIIMNSRPRYDDDFLNFLSKELRGLNRTNAVKLLNCLHSLDYNDQLHDLLVHFFKRMGQISLSSVCSDNFYSEIITKNIVSSKHNQDVVIIKNVIDALLTDIFLTKYDKKFKFEDISDTQKSLYRRIMIYGIAYNIKRRLCEEK